MRLWVRWPRLLTDVLSKQFATILAEPVVTEVEFFEQPVFLEAGWSTYELTNSETLARAYFKRRGEGLGVPIVEQIARQIQLLQNTVLGEHAAHFARAIARLPQSVVGQRLEKATQ